jgi:hypothetical protein
VRDHHGGPRYIGSLIDQAMSVMPNKPPMVFLDANVLISAGKPPGGPEVTRVRDLVEPI